MRLSSASSPAFSRTQAGSPAPSLVKQTWASRLRLPLLTVCSTQSKEASKLRRYFSTQLSSNFGPQQGPGLSDGVVDRQGYCLFQRGQIKRPLSQFVPVDGYVFDVEPDISGYLDQPIVGSAFHRHILQV